ncbi:MAG TPA: acetyl-CoA carboxylase biotin carboxyl carrier protein subunit [Atribacterota bacterium]|nr:acetyl-CoA carboxylase biotin carboxyl carrier protein subunit [Atribacterota bacterium]
MKQFKIKVDGKEYLVEVEEVGAVESSPAAPVIAKVEPKERTGETKKVEAKPEKNEEKQPAPVSSAEGDELKAPLPGKILKINFLEGDSVSEGDTVVILEAMKMENEILANSSGKIKKIFVAVNDMVETDDTLLIIG